MPAAGNPSWQSAANGCRRAGHERHERAWRRNKGSFEAANALCLADLYDHFECRYQVGR